MILSDSFNFVTAVTVTENNLHIVFPLVFLLLLVLQHHGKIKKTNFMKKHEKVSIFSFKAELGSKDILTTALLISYFRTLYYPVFFTVETGIT